MNTLTSTWRYDLFKLLVALVLIIVLLLSFLSRPTDSPGQEKSDQVTAPPVATEPQQDQDESSPQPSDAPDVPLPDTSIALTPDDTGKYLLTPDGRRVYELDEENQRWLPVIPEEIREKLQDGYQLVESDPTSWSIESKDGRTVYAWDQTTLTWTPLEPEDTASDDDCPVLLSPRLQVGEAARVKFNLNMRSSPGIKDNWMLTNISGTELKVIGGPACVVQEGGAYWWWEVENPSGLRGWSAEANQQGLYYFLEPVSP
jgi:hypothetical protein